MGILTSFNVGVSGLNAAGGGMSVIADNIANAATIGFKSSRAEFQDILATSLKGIDGGDQIGSGTKLATIKPLFTQGGLQRTENVTDLAMNGGGFFVVDAPFGKGVTRDGSFQFDKDGYLTTNDGYRVMGFKANEIGEITNAVDQVKLGGVVIPAKATSKVSVQMNLDSRALVKEFSLENPEKTSNFNSSIVLYDNVGTARMVTVYFNKQENNKWQYHAVISGEDAADGDPNKLYEMAKGQLVYSDKGILQEEIEQENSFNFNKGAAPGQKITMDFGQSLKEGGNGLDASTQFGSENAVSRHSQDGASAASLASLSFNDKGILTAVYNNGEIRDLFQIGVAKFENPEGLFKVGKNLFKETRRSGQGVVGKPREGGRGEVLSKSIEQSNVDIAQEFVNLMTAQRNFTANTRSVTTADQMLQDILNLKR